MVRNGLFVADSRNISALSFRRLQSRSPWIALEEGTGGEGPRVLDHPMIAGRSVYLYIDNDSALLPSVGFVPPG